MTEYRYIITYNGKEVERASTYSEANTKAHLLGNGVFEEILIIDTSTAEILSKL